MMKSMLLQHLSKCVTASFFAVPALFAQEKSDAANKLFGGDKGGAIAAAAIQVSENEATGKGVIPVNNDKGAISDKFKSIIIPKVKYENLTIEEVIEKVKRAAREQDPDKKGVNIILSLKAAETERFLINLERDSIPVGELIREVCQVAGLKYHIDGNLVKIASPGIQISENEAVDKGVIPVNNDKGAISDKFKSIIIPKVKYENLTIEEVIEKVKRAAREQDPDKKGVNIILSLKAAETERLLINLERDSIPVGELIREICQVAGLKYHIDGNLVKIASPGLTIETKYFLVPAGFFDLVAANKNVGGAKPDPAVPAGHPAADGKNKVVLQHFINSGVKFEAGCWLAFVQPANRLVVSNTPEELRKIETIIEQLTIAAQQKVDAKPVVQRPVKKQ